MEVFMIFPKSKQAQQELGQELAKFQSEQVLKTVQKLPCSTEQKLELVDAAVKHLKKQKSYRKPSRLASSEAGLLGFVDAPCIFLLIFFFQKPFEQGRIIACAVGNVVNIDRFSNQPIHADIFSRDDIAVSAVSQFLIQRDMAGQREHLQTGKRIQNQIGDVPR